MELGLGAACGADGLVPVGGDSSESDGTSSESGLSTSDASDDEDEGTDEETSVSSSDDGSSSSGGAENLAPSAADDQLVVREGQALVIGSIAAGLLANDVDPEGDALRVTDHEPATMLGGKVDVEADGRLRYDPPSDVPETLADRFAYTVADVHGATATAIVVITVLDVPPPSPPD
jgi:hypothetical protein